VVFTQEEIGLCRRLRDAGLPWEPGVGHFVYDEAELIEAPSPFQDRVYFILDMKHFMRRSKTVEELKRAMFWLPLWHQARAVARELDVSDGEVVERLRTERALESRTELNTLLQLVLGRLVGEPSE
jgi:hypothetical protein